MTLYRAVYARADGGLKPRCLTFTAPDAERAAHIAEDWQLPSDALLELRALRRTVLPSPEHPVQLRLA